MQALNIWNNRNDYSHLHDLVASLIADGLTHGEIIAAVRHATNTPFGTDDLTVLLVNAPDPAPGISFYDYHRQSIHLATALAKRRLNDSLKDPASSFKTSDLIQILKSSPYDPRQRQEWNPPTTAHVSVSPSAQPLTLTDEQKQNLARLFPDSTYANDSSSSSPDTD